MTLLSRADIILAGMAQSFLQRVWNAVKPPPAPPPRRQLNRSQRRLLRVTAIVIALGASGWSIYAWIASAPDRALGHDIEGTRLFGAGDFQGALAQFSDAIKISPEYADAYVGRGKAEVALGQTEIGLADFGKAMAINPTLEQPYTQRGLLWRSRGDLAKALADFSRSIAIQPRADAYYQRGLTHQMLGDAQRAVSDYNLAIGRDPAAPYFYRARAKAERDLDHLADAQTDQETAERLEETQ
jgi:tetratricopeptide (TPR) repeat protein